MTKLNFTLTIFKDLVDSSTVTYFTPHEDYTFEIDLPSYNPKTLHVHQNFLRRIQKFVELKFYKKTPKNSKILIPTFDVNTRIHITICPLDLNDYMCGLYRMNIQHVLSIIETEIKNELFKKYKNKIV